MYCVSTCCFSGRGRQAVEVGEAIVDCCTHASQGCGKVTVRETAGCDLLTACAYFSISQQWHLIWSLQRMTRGGKRGWMEVSPHPDLLLVGS